MLIPRKYQIMIRELASSKAVTQTTLKDLSNTECDCAKISVYFYKNASFGPSIWSSPIFKIYYKYGDK